MFKLISAANTNVTSNGSSRNKSNVTDYLDWNDAL